MIVIFFYSVKEVKEVHEDRVQQQHIMISYSWSQKPIVRRLVESLKSVGLKVWLDEEQMQGSTLEASTFFFFSVSILYQ
jgi:hypothetical protein